MSSIDNIAVLEESKPTVAIFVDRNLVTEKFPVDGVTVRNGIPYRVVDYGSLAAQEIPVYLERINGPIEEW
jgi:hypothetical protein